MKSAFWKAKNRGKIKLTRNKPWVNLGVIGLVILLALIQVHHIFLFYSESLNANIDEAIRLTTGHPAWRVHQNRVLGPYLLKGIASLNSGDYVGSYTILMTASLALAGYQAWRIGSKFGEGNTGLFALAIMHLSFAVLFAKPWLPFFSFFSLNIFLAFVDFVVYERPWYWFCALFSIAILNRESAQFIALWMILEPACRWLIRRPLPNRITLIMAITGVVCIAAGQWIIGYLRSSLLVEEVGFQIIGGTPSGYGPDYFWALPSNLDFLRYFGKISSLVDFVSILLPLAMLILIIFFIAVLVSRDMRYLALAITYLVAAVAVFLFGFIQETHVFVEFIPLLILGSCLLVSNYRGAPINSLIRGMFAKP